MDALRAFIADWLDPLGIVLGLIALVPIFWTWWDVVFGRRRRQRRWFAEISRRPGERPAILIVDLPELHRELRKEAAQLLNAGTDCIHYFHAGPAIAAALVGAEFANGARVLFYQHEGGSYRNFGPLRRMGD